MFIVNKNMESFGKLYGCNEKKARDLIYQKHLAPIGKSEDGKTWYFVKTEKLEVALRELSFFGKKPALINMIKNFVTTDKKGG